MVAIAAVIPETPLTGEAARDAIRSADAGKRFLVSLFAGAVTFEVERGAELRECRGRQFVPVRRGVDVAAALVRVDQVSVAVPLAEPLAIAA